MPPRASASLGSAAGDARQQATAAAAAAGAPSTYAAAQSSPGPQPESFVAQKLRWALAVPPEQRQPSMQGFIDSCECTAEAARLLAAALLAQLSGPTKLRALLLLLKAYWAFAGKPPHVPGVSLHCATAAGPGPEQAQQNLQTLLLEVGLERGHTELHRDWLVTAACEPTAVGFAVGFANPASFAAEQACCTLACTSAELGLRATGVESSHASRVLQDPTGGPVELQPLYGVASHAAYLTASADAACFFSGAASIANSSVPAVAESLHGRSAAVLQRAAAPDRLGKVADAIEALCTGIRRGPFGDVMQRQAANLGSGLLSVWQLERGSARDPRRGAHLGGHA